MKTIGGSRPSASAVWATATLFVTIVSCCSLIGVSIMPLISGPSYKVFITLFTGLAVGSLVGSAIFSLIPQAFNLHTIHNDGNAYLWKALVIFFGIYLFYCSERMMRIYFERRTRNRNKKQLKENNFNELSDNSTGLSSALNKQQDSKERDIEAGTSIQDNSDPLIIRRVSSELDNKANQGTIIKRHSGDSLALGPLAHDKSNSNLNNLDVAIVDKLNRVSNEDEKAESTVQNVGCHHHHHTNLNPHEIINSVTATMNGSIKKEIAPVAWMIIIGDGLHNFIDGLSIGAAFSESIYFGMSTSVAVICEEFPHELGDFAVLISSGMTVKQALGFNFLSACTCYIGMVFGILLGDMTQSASYIFALAGGMFLYIALVDMMGELSATLDEPNQPTKETMKLLLMQNIGILTGIIVIFSLAWIDV